MSKGAKKVQVSLGGLGFGSFLVLLMTIFNITGNATIPWVWVFSPIWIPPLVVMGAFVIMLIIFTLIAVFGFVITALK